MSRPSLSRFPRSYLRRVPVPDTGPLSGLGGPRDLVLLELDLSRGLNESAPNSPLAAVQGLRTPQLRTLVEHLRRAEDDEDVVGLIALLGGARLTLAQSAELRAAIARLGESGRLTVAWAPSFGELLPAMTAYHLATACEEIWMQPTGAVGLHGFAAEMPFVGQAFDRIGVQTQFSARHEYKSAVETFTRSDLSEPNREMTTRLLESATELFSADVASARNLSLDAVRALMPQAPLNAQAALKAGLIDALGYRDEAYTELKARLRARAIGDHGSLDDAPEVALSYVERYGSSTLDVVRRQMQGLAYKMGGRDQVAVIQAVGPIMEGRARPTPFGGSSVGADSLGAVLRAAGRADQVKAVVLRVDSPGGSYIASDAIRREVMTLRQQGITVVASMASVAASGGYYIAMGCDRIVANPGTITGSIGVFAGKAVLREALSRIGVTRTTIVSAPRADMFSSNVPFDDDELAALDAWLDTVYSDFVSKAAHDRSLTYDQVHEVARGRVWTGADAHERGLVDTLGGLDAAIDLACELADLDREAVDVRTLPKANPLEMFSPGQNSDAVQAHAGAVVDAGGWMQALAGEGVPLWRALHAAWAPSAGVLSMPTLRLPGLLPE